MGDKMEKIKTISNAIITFLIFILICFGLSCKKESSEDPTAETTPAVGTEVDVQKIEDLTGVQFKICKTKAVGYMPLHKFYWVCLQEKVSHQKVEGLAHEIIKETIAKKPKTYHSFTIHFFFDDELAETTEKSECCARATFLPEGSWLKVGRIPIDDYKSYKLTCTFF